MSYRTWFSRLAALCLAATAFAGAASAEPVNTGHLEAQLAPQTAGVAPGGTIYVAISQKILAGWHTYWRNPGDSGQATSVTWTLPQGWSAGDVVWPAPQRLPLGPLMNYGYTGQALLPVPIHAPASARPGDKVELAAKVMFLVCADLCIPEQAELKLSVPVVSGSPPADPQWGALVGKALADAPKPAGLKAAVAWQGQGDDRHLALSVVGAALKGIDPAGGYVFPYDPGALDHAAPQAIERGADGVTFTLKPGPAPTGAGAAPPEFKGVLSLAGHAYEIDAQPGPLLAGAGGLGSVAPAASGGAEGAAASSVAAVAPAPAKAAPVSLVVAIVSAFVGGLILNLMPCVFPVLSMKAASLARHAHEPREARVQGLAFLAGVVVVFLGLAAILLAAKAGGAAIGWGFQLQSPGVVGALALVMLLVALNLSGVFEARLPGAGAGSDLAGRGGLAGAFFTGALAVLVAAPCTAPFMAAALGFALTQNAIQALAVFLALGLGFAAPFVLIAFIPGLLRRMPKPGGWMETLRHVLAFPMYATAAWLVWVFSLQTASAALALLLAAAVLAAFTAWLVGAAQTANRPLLPGGGALVAAVLAIACLTVGARQGRPAVAQAAAADAPVQAWSPERLAALRAQGKPVLVNFTAAWCVTCQVNDRVALSTAKTKAAFARTGTVYMEADWTNHDAAIAKALAEHGRAGVPLYLVYGARGGDPAVLPQLLTEGVVISALDAAAKAPG